MNYPQILAIGDILISAALLTERFACDIADCKGLCCVEGNSGAPLEPEEPGILEREYPRFADYMSPQGREAVRQEGFAVVDSDGELVTPLIKGAECAYAGFIHEDICVCAIEQAYLAQKTGFRKPISCWLYPIRLKKLSSGIALNYHQWEVCSGACAKGQKEGMPVYRFVKQALVHRFGKEFYDQLEEAAGMMINGPSDGSL